MTAACSILGDPSVFPVYAFDGSTNYLSKAANLTGISSSKTGLISLFPYWNTNLGRSIFAAKSAGNDIISVSLTPANPAQIQVTLSDATGANSWSFKSTSTFAVNTWKHILISWDTGYSAGSKVTYIYANDTDLGATTVSDSMGNANVGWADATNWYVGSDSSGTSLFTGCMAQLAFYPGVTFDITNSSNRRLFSDSSFHPIYLGESGATPTGTAATVYIGNSPSSIGTNKGTGGNFTANGSFSACSSSP